MNFLRLSLAVIAVAGTLAGSASAVTNPPHGHYVRDIIGQLELVCDSGYYGTSSTPYGQPDRCSPIPSVATATT